MSMSRVLSGAFFSTLMATCAFAEPLKVGFVVTMSGPGAVIGQDMTAGFKLGMKHAGLDTGPNAVQVLYEDDQLKADVGRQVTTKLLEQERANLITGMIWSNVLLASAKPVFDANAILISANAGPSDLSGKQCNANFFGVAFQNDTLHEPGGQYAQNKGIKRLGLIAPNYPAGKDALNGVKRFYKGAVAAELYPALDQFDFAAEIAQLRDAKAEAVYFFFAGAQAISFIKQYEQAGLSKTMPLIGAIPSLDAIVRNGVGAAAVGATVTTYWDDSFDNPTNKKFVDAFVAEQKRKPSGYAATAYDTATLIAAALKKVGGDVANRKAFSTALATVEFPSVRGNFKFNTNHMPIQNFYAGPIIADGDGKSKIGALEEVFKDHKDNFAAACPLAAN
jgi:branched-chain amino acid transport system substrate-binding protein